MPERVIGVPGHLAGRQMPDYGGFDDLASAKAARFLVVTIIVSPGLVSEFGGSPAL